MEAPPVLQIMEGAQYLGAFNELNKKIPEDIKILERKHIITRPNIIFLTAGNPTDKSDEWLNVRNKMLESSWRPNILAFGYGSATEQTVTSIATEIKGSDPAKKHAYIFETAVEPPDLMLIDLLENLAAGVSRAGGLRGLHVATPSDL